MSHDNPFTPAEVACAQDTTQIEAIFHLENSIGLPYLIWKEIAPHILFDPNDTNKPKRSLYQQSYAIRGVRLRVKTAKPLPRNPSLKKYARHMRNESTIAEIIFWMHVTNGRFHNIDFDRQVVIGNYIVDFYVHKLQLVIEIDGDSHNGKGRYDALREAELKALGLTIYRIDAADVTYGIKTTLVQLERFILETYG